MATTVKNIIDAVKARTGETGSNVSDPDFILMVDQCEEALSKWRPQALFDPSGTFISTRITLTAADNALKVPDFYKAHMIDGVEWLYYKRRAVSTGDKDRRMDSKSDFISFLGAK